MFNKKFIERVNMAEVNNNISFTNNGNSVIISNQNTVMTFPKGTLSLHAEENKTDSIEVRLMASRKNILSFSYKNITNPICENVEDAITKLNNII